MILGVGPTIQCAGSNAKTACVFKKTNGREAKKQLNKSFFRICFDETRVRPGGRSPLKTQGVGVSVENAPLGVRLLGIMLFVLVGRNLPARIVLGRAVINLVWQGTQQGVKSRERMRWVARPRRWLNC